MEREDRLSRLVDYKRETNAIAHQAARMVDPGSVIAFNGGTTTTAAAFEVGVRAAAEDRFAGPETTVVTNAVNIANDLIRLLGVETPGFSRGEQTPVSFLLGLTRTCSRV